MYICNFFVLAMLYPALNCLAQNPGLELHWRLLLYVQKICSFPCKDQKYCMCMYF